MTTLAVPATPNPTRTCPATATKSAPRLPRPTRTRSGSRGRLVVQGPHPNSPPVATAPPARAGEKITLTAQLDPGVILVLLHVSALSLNAEAPAPVRGTGPPRRLALP